MAAPAAAGEKDESAKEGKPEAKSERGDKSRSRSRARKDEKKDVLTLDRIKVHTVLQLQLHSL